MKGALRLPTAVANLRIGLIHVALAALLACSESPAAATGEPAHAAISRALARHAEARGVEAGVTAIHLQRGDTFSINGNVAFPLASTYKVPMAAYALHLVARGDLDLARMVDVPNRKYVISSGITRSFPHPGVALSVANLIEATLILSDNTATDVLLELIGGGEAVTGWLQASGIDGLRVDRGTGALIGEYLGIAPPPDGLSPAEAYDAAEDTLAALSEAERQDMYAALQADPRDQGTPRAMATFLAKLWAGELLPEDETALIRATMARCLTGANRISGRLPAESLPVAHKTGTLGGTVNDVGVLTLPEGGGDVVLVVFTRGEYGEGEAAEAAIADIARSVYDYFAYRPTER